MCEFLNSLYDPEFDIVTLHDVLCLIRRETGQHDSSESLRLFLYLFGPLYELQVIRIVNNPCTRDSHFDLNYFLPLELTADPTTRVTVQSSLPRSRDFGSHLISLPQLLLVSLDRAALPLAQHRMVCHVDPSIHLTAGLSLSRLYSRRYTLFGVVVHFGTTESGHYKSFHRALPGSHLFVLLCHLYRFVEYHSS